MAQPKFIVHSASGEPVAGDDRADGHLKEYAQKHLGYVTDRRTGEVVFDARAEVTVAAPFAQDQLGPFDTAVADSTDTNPIEENEQ